MIPLRPLTLGDILGGAFGTLGRYWKQLAGFTLAVQFATLLVVVALGALGLLITWSHLDGAFDPGYGQDPAPEDMTPVLATFIPLGVIALMVALVSMALTAAAIPAVVQEAVLGRPITIGTVFLRAKARAASVLGVTVLTGLLAALPAAAVLLVGIPLLIATENDDGSGGVSFVTLFPFLFLVTLPFAAWIWVRYGLATAAAVCEGLGPVTAMRRSAKLVRHSWWRIFGCSLLIGLIAVVMAYVVQLVFTLVGVAVMIPTVALSGPDADFSAGIVIVTVLYVLFSVAGSALSQLFFPTLPQLGSALLYVDQRIRQEDLVSGLLAADRPAY
ncbi:hypothetical protein [Streptomyces sp. NPDC051211]|uniref:hypothetical protein n=1 Tax=Streptomyces sp. NPDC051211 TaxID=3154643 RepID=UPI00344F8B89